MNANFALFIVALLKHLQFFPIHLPFLHFNLDDLDDLDPFDVLYPLVTFLDPFDVLYPLAIFLDVLDVLDVLYPLAFFLDGLFVFSSFDFFFLIIFS